MTTTHPHPEEHEVTRAPDVAAVADAYAKAWNSRDVDAVLAHHAEDSTFHSHGHSAAVKGIDALREEFKNILELFPGFHAEVRRLLLGDRHWTLDWTLHFEPATGGKRGFGCIDIVEIDDDGLVTRKDTYFDPASFRRAMEGATA